MRISRGGGGGTGGLEPLKNHKNIGVLSITGPDLLKNHKDTKLERSGSVVECFTQDRGAAGSSLTASLCRAVQEH